jgi:hypothetical protein
LDVGEARRCVEELGEAQARSGDCVVVEKRSSHSIIAEQEATSSPAVTIR